ncbi:MAG: hypothetical protein AXW14_00245 [Alteromonas sp. Nap_26]|nr:MAG: hypothetical protein AXW14_00245 [Alteromonas sp. Nap_26]
MKNLSLTLASIVAGSLLTLGAFAQDAGEQSVDENLFHYEHQGTVYPPVFFVTNVEDKAIKGQIEKYNAFSALDDKAVGLPIGVRVLKGHRTKQDGTQFSSLMLSASTLGIIPVVSNTEFKVRYDVFVQGKSIESFEYVMDSTDVNNFWTSAYRDFETSPTEEQFLRDTVPQFLKELKASKVAQENFAEYWEYFSE